MGLVSNGLLSSSAKSDTHYDIGKFRYPTLGKLRSESQEIIENNDSSDKGEISKLTFNTLIADVQSLHGKVENKFAIFQVASQFNCLEFVSPGVTPESGVTDYSNDRTQGPACCLCTGPAITYRNYLHYYEDEIAVGISIDSERATARNGQRKERQADMLSDFSRKIGNNVDDNGGGKGVFWDMKGGYAMSNSKRLQKIPWNKFLTDDSNHCNKYDELMQTLRIGIHEDIEVTHFGGFGIKKIQNKDMKVTHCLCSAVPVSYNTAHSRASDWEPLARIILKASYECVFHAAILNMMRHHNNEECTGSRKIFLTKVGGGVFGNRSSWINDAIIHCCQKFKKFNLEVCLVCYGQVDLETKKLTKEVRKVLQHTLLPNIQGD